MKKPIWEGVYKTFEEVPSTGSGFRGKTWIDNSLKKISALHDNFTSRKVALPSTVNRDSLLPVLAALAGEARQDVTLLDYGGGTGFSYFQVAGGMPDSAGIEFHIVEVEDVCASGRAFFKDFPRIHFHAALPALGRVDIVSLGSSLHYVRDWKRLLQALCGYRPRYVLIMDLPAGDIPTFATAQNYYESKIPVWFFNLGEVVAAMKRHGYRLIYKSSYCATILGDEQSLRLDNFDDAHRIEHSCNLLFTKEREHD
jgi:putative methyltransferase (TIGR04325 family)